MGMFSECVFRFEVFFSIKNKDPVSPFGTMKSGKPVRLCGRHCNVQRWWAACDGCSHLLDLSSPPVSGPSPFLHCSSSVDEVVQKCRALLFSMKQHWSLCSGASSLLSQCEGKTDASFSGQFLHQFLRFTENSDEEKPLQGWKINDMHAKHEDMMTSFLRKKYLIKVWVSLETLLI